MARTYEVVYHTACGESSEVIRLEDWMNVNRSLQWVAEAKAVVAVTTNPLVIHADVWRHIRNTFTKNRIVMSLDKMTFPQYLDICRQEGR